MMIYSPKHIAPRRVDSLTTQIDIAPTVLGLLGLPYTAPFFGRDVLNTPQEHRVAFFSHNHDVALYKDGKLSILGLRKPSRTSPMTRPRHLRDAPPDPQLNALAIAYYQTAYRALQGASIRLIFDAAGVSPLTDETNLDPKLTAESELVRRMLAGDEQAFNAFFTSHFPRLFRFALPRLNGEVEAAREVVQATLGKGMRRLPVIAARLRFSAGCARSAAMKSCD